MSRCAGREAEKSGGRAAGVERDGRGKVFRREKGSLTHYEPPAISSEALDMRNAGSQLRRRTLLLFPKKVLY